MIGSTMARGLSSIAVAVYTLTWHQNIPFNNPITGASFVHVLNNAFKWNVLSRCCRTGLGRGRGPAPDFVISYPHTTYREQMLTTPAPLGFVSSSYHGELFLKMLTLGPDSAHSLIR